MLAKSVRCMVVCSVQHWNTTSAVTELKVAGEQRRLWFTRRRHSDAVSTSFVHNGNSFSFSRADFVECIFYLLSNCSHFKAFTYTDPGDCFIPTAHMHAKRVSARLERRQHKAGTSFPRLFIHIQNETKKKKKVLPVTTQHVTLWELSVAAL